MDSVLSARGVRTLRRVRGPATAREASTLAARLGVWQRFLRWTQLRRIPVGAAAIRSYLAAGIRAGRAPSYMLTTLSHLNTGLARLAPVSPSSLLRLTDARSSIRRLLPFQELHQAVPADTRHVRLLERADPRGLGLLIRCLWHSAGRFSDWSGRLPASSVVPQAKDWFTITYRRTKTSHRGVSRTVMLRLPPSAAHWLRQRLRALPPHAALFRFPYGRVYTFVRHNCPGLTLHSFRRGAVQRMLDAGVPAREVARLTGHTSLATLYGYAHRLPRTARRAMQVAFVALQ